MLRAGGQVVSNQVDGLFDAAGEESDAIQLDGAALTVQVDLNGATASMLVWARINPLAPYVTVETIAASGIVNVADADGVPLALYDFYVESDSVSGGDPKVYFTAE